MRMGSTCSTCTTLVPHMATGASHSARTAFEHNTSYSTRRLLCASRTQRLLTKRPNLATNHRSTVCLHRPLCTKCSILGVINFGCCTACKDAMRWLGETQVSSKPNASGERQNMGGFQKMEKKTRAHRERTNLPVRTTYGTPVLRYTCRHGQ